MDLNISKMFCQAKRGREVWIYLRKKWGIDDNWFLVLFPEKNDCINEIALRKLDDFLERKYVDNALVVHYENYLINKLENTKNNIVFEDVKENDMLDMIKYYCLQQFFKNIVIVSIEQPFGSKGLIGHLGITLEDYIENAIYV